MTDLCDVPLSVLDLAPVSSGSSAAIALRNSRDLAQHVERLGYHRYWVAVFLRHLRTDFGRLRPGQSTGLSAELLERSLEPGEEVRLG